MYKKYKGYMVFNKKVAKNINRAEKRRIRAEKENIGVKITKTLFRSIREDYNYLMNHEDHFYGDNLKRADYILAQASEMFDNDIHTDGEWFEKHFANWHKKREG